VVAVAGRGSLGSRLVPVSDSDDDVTHDDLATALPIVKSLESSHLGWTGLALFVVLLGGVAEATAQVSPSTSRRLPAELRHLEDCHLLDGATLDVLRHGYVVVHRDKIIAEERESREAMSFLLGALSRADMIDPWQANLIDGATGFQWAGALSDYVASRESQREALRKDFRTAVRAGFASALHGLWLRPRLVVRALVRE